MSILWICSKFSNLKPIFYLQVILILQECSLGKSSMKSWKFDKAFSLHIHADWGYLSFQIVKEKILCILWENRHFLCDKCEKEVDQYLHILLIYKEAWGCNVFTWAFESGETVEYVEVPLKKALWTYVVSP